MADKFMNIPNYHTQNYLICRLQSVVERLDTQRNEANNQNSSKVPKSWWANELENVIIKLWGLV